MKEWRWGGEREGDEANAIRFDGLKFHFWLQPADERGYGMGESSCEMDAAELVERGPPWPLPLQIVRELAAATGAPSPVWLGVYQLCEACRLGDGALVLALLAAGVDPSGHLWHVRPLRAALEARQTELVRALLERGADPRAIDKNPLGFAASCLGDTAADEAVLLAMLAAGADWPKTSIGNPLYAVRHGRLARVLIAHRAPVNDALKDGYTPLLAAIANHRPGVVEALLEGGADLDRPNAKGVTPVLQCVLYVDLDCLDRLLVAGASLRPAATRDGKTPLEEAERMAKVPSLHNAPEVLRRLKEALKG